MRCIRIDATGDKSLFILSCIAQTFTRLTNRCIEAIQALAEVNEKALDAGHSVIKKRVGSIMQHSCSYSVNDPEKAGI